MSHDTAYTLGRIRLTPLSSDGEIKTTTSTFSLRLTAAAGWDSQSVEVIERFIIAVSAGP